MNDPEQNNDGPPVVFIAIVATIFFFIVLNCMGCPGGLFHGLGPN